MTTENPIPSRQRDPWNKGRLIGQKRPLKPKDVWTIRVRLQLGGRQRDLAMFNLAIDSKLRAAEQTRCAIGEWLAAFDSRRGRYLFASRFRRKAHPSTREYARVVHTWVAIAGLNGSAYGTLDATYEGGRDLKENQETAGGSASPGSYEA